MTQAELIKLITEREDKCLPLFDGDIPSQHDVMRWATKRREAETDRLAVKAFRDKRHSLFLKLYYPKLVDIFGEPQVNIIEKCYTFGGYTFYPHLNIIDIDGFRYPKAFYFIDRLIRQFNATCPNSNKYG